MILVGVDEVLGFKECERRVHVWASRTSNPINASTHNNHSLLLLLLLLLASFFVVVCWCVVVVLEMMV